MPKALNVDWNLAAVLYSQGVTYRDIAVRIGAAQACVRQRARRYHWRQLRATALQTVSQTVTGCDGKTLVQRSKEVRETLGADLAATAEHLRRTPVQPGLSHLGERAEVNGKLASSASKVFGWGAEHTGPRSVVMVGLGQYVSHEPDGLVIDVGSEQAAVTDRPEPAPTMTPS